MNFLTVFFIISIVMVGLTIFALVNETLTQKVNCENLIMQEKIIYNSSTDPEEHDWEAFDYYWSLNAYSCDKFYDKIDVKKEIRDE